MDIYTVGAVADILQVSGATIRRWAREFSKHLSSQANPGTGIAREFTADDIRVMAYAKIRLDRGVSVGLVEEELTTAALPTWSSIVGERAATPDDSAALALTMTGQRLIDLLTVGTAAQEQIAAALAGLAELNELRAELAELRARVARLEAAAHTHSGLVRGKPL